MQGIKYHEAIDRHADREVKTKQKVMSLSHYFRESHNEYFMHHPII